MPFAVIFGQYNGCEISTIYPNIKHNTITFENKLTVSTEEVSGRYPGYLEKLLRFHVGIVMAGPQAIARGAAEVGSSEWGEVNNPRKIYQ